MQSLTEWPREDFTEAEVQYLVENTSAFDTRMGVELIDDLSTMGVQDDLSNDLTAATVSRNNFAEIHGTATFSIDRELSWGNSIVRAYMEVTGPTSATATSRTTMRFYQGAYFVEPTEEDLSTDVSTFGVTGHDVLSILDDPVGDDYSIDQGALYLAVAEQILIDRGITRYHIDQSQANTTAVTPKVWISDERVTWLQVVNHCLAAVGYQGVWTDWNGAFQLREYITPSDRAPEWWLTADIRNTLLTNQRRRSRNFYNAPNRWVFYQSNMTELAPVDGNGRYEYVNQYRGETSVEARGGRTISKDPEGVDVADHAALVRYATRVIDADTLVPTKVTQEIAPFPLAWHMDRYLVTDPQLGVATQILGTGWTANLDGSNVPHDWTVVV